MAFGFYYLKEVKTYRCHQRTDDRSIMLKGDLSG